MTLRTERPPVRPRSGRRPLPPLIFLLVLAVAALGVWWHVLQQDSTREAVRTQACATAAPAAPSLDPTTVSVRVLNATDQAGLAQTVADQLRGSGFQVDDVDNDRSGRKVTGVGEVRHGPRGQDPARYLSLYLPGAGDYLDTRATAQVDLVLGPDFTSLASAEQVAADLRSGGAAAGAC